MMSYSNLKITKPLIAQLAIRVVDYIRTAQPECMNRKQLAEYMSVSEKTIRNWELSEEPRYAMFQSDFPYYSRKYIDSMGLDTDAMKEIQQHARKPRSRK